MKKLFICYSHINIWQVRQIVQVLTHAGHEPWFDSNLLPGQDWKEQSINFVKQCDIFIYIMSPESVKADWCEWELAQAIELDKPIVPILIHEDTAIPNSISNLQYLNCSEGLTLETVASLVGSLTELAIKVSPKQLLAKTLPPLYPPVLLNREVFADSYTEHDTFNSITTWHKELIDSICNLDLSPEQRDNAGRKLAEIGDPRRGVGLRKDGIPDISWCQIPASEFIYQNNQKSYLPTFYLARYPVTYLQFKAFIDAPDGFYSDSCWKGLGWQEARPSTRHQTPNTPCVKVNWYEAMAFCNWLSIKLNFKVMLPAEWEWEKAACGENGYNYSSGKEYKIGSANLNERRNGVGLNFLGRTSVVGIYTPGVYGISDINGNIWEWTSSKFAKQVNFKNSTGSFVLRGGSWRYDALNASARYRFRAEPMDRLDDVGFRLACVYPMM